MSRPGRSGDSGDRAAVIGLALTALWLALVGLFWLFGPEGDGQSSGLMRLASLFGVLLPPALIWIAVGLARAIAALRAEADQLRAHMSQMQADVPVPESASAGLAALGGAARPDAPSAPPPATAPVAARPHPPSRPQPLPSKPPRLAPADARQAAMRFEAPESVAVDPEDLIRALNFPDGPDDHAAIASLHAALRDHENARMLRSAQDVVTLLAGADLYMDNLLPEPVPAALWRRFAEGQRGASVAALDGIRDADAQQMAAHLMRGDEVFRDAAHHFLRHFDLLLGRLVPQLDDAQIGRLAQTRSARAFLLLGHVAGVFGEGPASP